MFQVNTSLIRFWHKEFEAFIKPKINAKGNRLFTPKDVVNFSKIYQLVKEEGYTLDGAKKALKSKPTSKSASSEELPMVENTQDASQLKVELLERLESLKTTLLNTLG